MAAGGGGGGPRAAEAAPLGDLPGSQTVWSHRWALSKPAKPLQALQRAVTGVPQAAGVWTPGGCASAVPGA